MPSIFNPTRSDLIDLSIIPSYHCNLRCSFCMYDCSSDQKDIINLDKLRRFIDTISWNKINSIGLYGGEISLYIPICNDILNMIPKCIPKFCITNGWWSNDELRKEEFLLFCKIWNVKIVVSSTPQHQKYQNHFVLKSLENERKVMIKPDDTLDRMNPMGRLSDNNWTCSFKCKNISKPKRFAICPNGDIIFQNCDGVYPVVSDYTKDFNTLQIKCERR